MKKLTALVTALILILSSLMLASCDLGDTSDGETKSDSTSDTTADSESNTVTDAVKNNGENNSVDNSGDNTVEEIATEGGTRVEGLNDKTPYQLYCDAVAMMNECAEGKQQIWLKGSAPSGKFELKLSANSGYFSLYDGRQEGWHLGKDMLYGKDGSNYNTSEMQLSYFKSYCLTEIFDNFWYVNLSEEDLNGTELFKTSEGIYYFTVKRTIEGTEQAITYAFGENGVIRQFKGVAGEYTTLCAFTVGDVPEITLPDGYGQSSSGNSDNGNSGNNGKVDGAIPPVTGGNDTVPSNPGTPSEDSNRVDMFGYTLYMKKVKNLTDEHIPKVSSEDDFSYLLTYDDGSVIRFELKSNSETVYEFKFNNDNITMTIYENGIETYTAVLS